MEMKPGDYEFNIGDEVVTTFGEVGRITDICKCEACKKRGFHEPIWTEDGYGDKHYITTYMAEDGFEEFYQIGKYRFNKLFNKNYVKREIADYENQLRRWRGRLAVIEALEKENN